MATASTGYPTKEFKSGFTRSVFKGTFTSGEAYAFTHTDLKDVDLIRSVRVYNASGTLVNTTSTIVLTSSTVTTVTVPASAGVYTIVVEL